MSNLSACSPFIDQFIQDPLEVFKAEQDLASIKNDTPFVVISNDTSSLNHSPVTSSTKYKDSNNLQAAMPDRLKVTVGENTFSLSSHFKIGVR